MLTGVQGGNGVVTISYSYATLSYAPVGGISFGGTQAQQTLSAPSAVTITNNGAAPLQISGLTFAGADPQDFLISSNGCMAQVAAGSSCTLGVSFAPQGTGTRTATLQIASNDPDSPASVALSGTGGQLPSGPQGATGPQGPAGQIELVTCKTITVKVVKKIHGKRRTVSVKRQSCSAKLVSGPVKFTTSGAVVHATISRGRIVYATGTSSSVGAGRSQLVLTERRPLRPGRYALSLRTRRAGRWITRQVQITVT
jgi:Cep192 domain 4